MAMKNEDDTYATLKLSQEEFKTLTSVMQTHKTYLERKLQDADPTAPIRNWYPKNEYGFYQDRLALTTALQEKIEALRVKPLQSEDDEDDEQDDESPDTDA